MPGATGYDLTLVDATSVNAYSLSVQVLGTSFIPSPDLTNGETYNWYVRAFVGSGDTPEPSHGSTIPYNGVSGTFTVDTTSGDTGSLVPPTLVAPADGDLATAPTFQWSPVPGATGYALYLSTPTNEVFDYSGNGASLYTTTAIPPDVTDVYDVTGTSYVPPNPLVNGADYQWWVRAYDGSGDASSISTKGAFRAPLLQTSPSDGESVPSYAPTFRWMAAPGNASYELLVRDTINNAVILDVQNLATTSYTPGVPFAEGHTYTWSVVATSVVSSGPAPTYPITYSTVSRTPGVVTSFTISAPGGANNTLSASLCDRTDRGTDHDHALVPVECRDRGHGLRPLR